VSKARDFLVAAATLLVGRGRKRRLRPGEKERIVVVPTPTEPDADREQLGVGLLWSGDGDDPLLLARPEAPLAAPADE